MTVVVSIITPSGLGTTNAPGIGRARVKNVLTVPGTTTGSLQSGEVFMVANGEAADMLVATGTIPDAQANLSTAVTTAGAPSSIGSTIYVTGNVGDLLNVKAVA